MAYFTKLFRSIVKSEVSDSLPGMPGKKWHGWIIKERRGFSILELIIYIGIFGIMGVLGAFVFDFSVRSKQITTRSNEVYANTQRAFSQVVERVHSAVVINGASTTLNLKMSDGTKDPTIFSLSGGALMIQEGSANATSVTPSTVYITSLQFIQVTNPSPATTSVRIKITAGYNDGGAADTNTLYSLQTTALPL